MRNRSSVAAPVVEVKTQSIVGAGGNTGSPHNPRQPAGEENGSTTDSEKMCDWCYSKEI